MKDAHPDRQIQHGFNYRNLTEFNSETKEWWPQSELGEDRQEHVTKKIKLSLKTYPYNLKVTS